MVLKIRHDKEIDYYIQRHHFLHTTPAGAIIRMEFLDDNSEVRIGAMMWGRNPSPKQDQACTLCLTRMYFEDSAPKCTESHALAMARKYIRKHYPQIKGVVAYASLGAEHNGTIYKADGWFEVSRSKNGAKDCREGRKNVDTSTKIKFVRTP